MNAFSTTELSRMQAHQTASMMDRGRVLVYAATDDDYGTGAGAATYTAQASTVCGWKPTAKEVLHNGQVAITDGKLRLPFGTVVSNLDRFELTHRHGVALALAETYEILGQPERGPSGLVLNLRMVTDGSDE